jgi:hypothetical protein
MEANGMDCIECKTTNPEENHFCGKCGAELGRMLDETVRKKGFRDRQATEMEITASVAERLLKWTTWLGSALALILVTFGFFIGKSWLDVRSAVATGQTRIENAARDGKQQIDSAAAGVSGLQQTAASVKKQYDDLQSDVGKYKLANDKIAELQKELIKIKKDVVDLGDRDLKARSVSTTGAGPSSLGFLHLGCPSPDASVQVAYCAQGSPPMLFQRSANGDLRPVSSVSPVGFRDNSSEPKPRCTTEFRGTIYVEKGHEGVADQPVVCAKTSRGDYAWYALGNVP